MTDTRFDDFLELLRSFDDAMLVTRGRDNELCSRPMAIADRTDDGCLWFITHVDGDAIRQVTQNPQVGVCLQDGKRFLSISGTARATRDAERIRQLWSENQRVWFEKGRDDPTLILLEVVPAYAEYWDRSGVEGVKFLVSELTALLGGRTLTGEEGRHGKVDFDRQQEQARLK